MKNNSHPLVPLAYLYDIKADNMENINRYLEIAEKFNKILCTIIFYILWILTLVLFINFAYSQPSLYEWLASSMIMIIGYGCYRKENKNGISPSNRTVKKLGEI